MEPIQADVIAQRKVLRKNVLRSFYDHAFKTGGTSYRNTGNFSEDTEKNLAFQYLTDTGLLYDFSQKGMTIVRISPSGIDFIENDSNF